VEPDRLVTIDPGNGNRISYPNYRDLGGSPAFAGTAVTTMGTVSLRDQNRVENVLALETSANYFQLLGAGAWLGRTFSLGDRNRLSSATGFGKSASRATLVCWAAASIGTATLSPSEESWATITVRVQAPFFPTCIFPSTRLYCPSF
jgi:hypothetical protein